MLQSTYVLKFKGIGMSKASAKKWAKENPEKAREKSRRWRRNNPEKLKLINAEQHKKHAVKIAKHRKERYREDPEKFRKRGREQYWKNPGKQRARIIKRLYNLTEDSYRELLDSTMGICPICKEEFVDDTVCVDHDHKTGRIRGIICHRCNLLLGRFDDDIRLILNAIGYLRKGENIET